MSEFVQDYVPGVDYRRDDRSLLTDEGVLDGCVADLLDIASTAYLADRSSPRGRVDDASWHRSLRVAVAAREPAMWKSRPVLDALLSLLAWLSDDEWDLDFIDGPATEAPAQLRLPLDSADREVALFSGGLDAVAGAALALHESRPLIGVGVCTNPHMRGYQRRTAQALRHVGCGDFVFSSVTLQRRGRVLAEDPTRRTRGLIFLVCGWAAARAAGRDELLVFENGVGAINLPYTMAQSGSMTSRAVHPVTLRLAADLFSLLSDRPFSVRNPHIADTKGEMCERLPDSARPAVEASESCDSSAAGRTALHRRCGRCASCLLRRVSLHAAGRAAWDPRPYRADIDGDDASSALPEVLWQAARLQRCLATEASQPGAFSREFPAAGEIPADAVSQTRLLAMYCRHVEEWRRYPHPRVGAFLGNRHLAA
ncbi:MAG TPA: hypothetical protein VHB69_00275 [Mycobacteriales bacterium]|nr:hypothetical protein [Mycobacteriales bacterium]